jgi:hypothetical protein
MAQQPQLYSIKGYKELYKEKVASYHLIRSNANKLDILVVDKGRVMIKDTPKNLEIASKFIDKKKGPKFKKDPSKNID